MERPWMKFHTRDWLDNKELRRCSPSARSVLTDLMCIAAEGYPYGWLKDRVGPLTTEYMAARCVIPIEQFNLALAELKVSERVHCEGNCLLIRRMVRDEEIRKARAEGGKLSEGNPNTQKKGTHPLQNEGTHVLKTTSRERVRADSDSSYVFIDPSQIPKPNGNGFHASESIHTAVVAVNGTEPKNGGNGIPALDTLTEYPLTMAEIRRHDPGVDHTFVLRLVQETTQACLSNPEFPEQFYPKINDAWIAKACAESFATGSRNHKAGLLLKRVPAIMATWAVD